MSSLIIATIKKGEPDRDYKTLVLLMRSDRPKYWTFHCVNCRMVVCHISNRDVELITDFYNAQDIENGGVDVRCSSCKRHYSFVLQ